MVFGIMMEVAVIVGLHRNDDDAITRPAWIQSAQQVVPATIPVRWNRDTGELIAVRLLQPVREPLREPLHNYRIAQDENRPRPIVARSFVREREFKAACRRLGIEDPGIKPRAEDKRVEQSAQGGTWKQDC